MSGQQKRGFRLPWAADRAPEEGAAGAATLDPVGHVAGNGVDSDDLGDGPFRVAGASSTSTEEAVPAASDAPEVRAEAAMIESPSTESPALAANEPPGGDAWPEVDRRTSAQHATDAEQAVSRPPIVAEGQPRPARRDNPLVAGLVKAMREAAVASRDETLSRLHTDAEARVENIRSRATEEAAELRKRADADVNDIREWSKAEMARIRQETEERIEARKTELAGETERHAASVERLVRDVHGVVEAFEGAMATFFERLLAEDDPARLAALAEQAPDAPDLTGDGPAAIDMLDAAADASAEAPVIEPEAREALEADAAAAAEAAATEGLDLAGDGEWPAAVMAAAQRADSDADGGRDDDGRNDDGTTRLLVTGLASVAGISALKGALGQLPGIQAVSVSSGDRGVFVFAVRHEPGIDLASGLTSLPGFGARITDATDAGIAVVAHEPAA